MPTTQATVSNNVADLLKQIQHLKSLKSSTAVTKLDEINNKIFQIIGKISLLNDAAKGEEKHLKQIDTYLNNIDNGVEASINALKFLPEDLNALQRIEEELDIFDGLSNDQVSYDAI